MATGIVTLQSAEGANQTKPCRWWRRPLYTLNTGWCCLHVMLSFSMSFPNEWCKFFICSIFITFTISRDFKARPLWQVLVVRCQVEMVIMDKRCCKHTSASQATTLFLYVSHTAASILDWTVVVMFRLQRTYPPCREFQRCPKWRWWEAAVSFCFLRT